MVIAVEPVHRNALLIELASELNGTSEIVQVICAAVSNKTGFIEMAGEEDSSYSSVKVDNTIGTGRTKAITIDHLVEKMNLPRVDILKMDIEGWEFHALQGMSALLSNRSARPRMMMIELFSDHIQRYGSSIDEVCYYLNGYGYEPYVLNKGSVLMKYESKHRNIIYNVFFLDSSRIASDE